MIHLSEILNELGESREDYFQAVAPPVIQSSNFSYPSVKSFRMAMSQEFEQPFYSRGYNPTVAMLRKKIAALEGAEDALVCGSGSAAVAIAVIGNLKAGDHVICVQKPYSWTWKLLHSLLSRFGIETSFIDGTSISHFEDALQANTRMVFIESPNSMTFELQDITKVAAFAKKNGLISLIDNSYASPIFQKPYLLGIDLVIHSATKFLNGHSDVVAGVICGSKAMITKLFSEEWMTLGPLLSPHDAWLILRGLRTLELRVNRSADSAALIVPQLKAHPKIEQVFFPFDESHPQYELAKKQMSRCAGLFSLSLRTNDAGIERFCDALQHFQLAVSWGGYESLVFPVAALPIPPEKRNPLIPNNLVRIYTGIEDTQLLLADLLQALDKI